LSKYVRVLRVSARKNYACHWISRSLFTRARRPVR
jgi:hypothetical protein